MKRTIPYPIMAAALLLASAWACGSSDTTPSINTGVCGMTAHQWLPAQQVGALRDSEKMALYSMNADTIAYLLASEGYGDVVQPRYDVQVHKYRYTTQDRGVSIEATSVVGYPELEDGQSLTLPVVLWLHGTTGFMGDCAPSATEEDAGLPAMIFASQGYVIVEPDYLGMNGFGDPSPLHHPYLVSEATALASWDALRAAEVFLAQEAPGVTIDPARVIIWGGSQGGHATLAAELYQPYYAPEYHPVAALALVPPSDLLSQTTRALTSFVPASLNLAAMLAAAGRWYGMGDRLAEVLTDDEPNHIAVNLPLLMDTTCDVESDQYQVDDIGDLYQPTFIEAALNHNWQGYEQWKCLLTENSFMYTKAVKRISDTPFMFVLSQLDDLVNSPIEEAAYDTLCSQGYRMNFMECEGAGHSQGALWSLPEQLDWVEHRLAGEDLADQCTRPAAFCCSLSDEDACTGR